jgi:hypothetical protein
MQTLVHSPSGQGSDASVQAIEGAAGYGADSKG